MLGRFLAWLRGGGDRDRPGDERDGSGDGTLWDVVPDWQYGSGGRLQGGGIARDTQEDAIEEVSERAEQLAEVEDR